MTLAARIVAYVAANPGATAEDVQTALGQHAGVTVAQLARQGRIGREKRQVLVRRPARAWCYHIHQQEA